MKYTIVSGRDYPKVQQEIMDLMAQGWILQGGVALDEGCVAQALIKHSTMGDLERPEFRRESVYVRQIEIDKRNQT